MKACRKCGSIYNKIYGRSTICNKCIWLKQKHKKELVKIPKISVIKTLKMCTVCKEEKNLYEFGKNKSRHDGIQTFCKKCSAHYRNLKVKKKILSNVQEGHKICTKCKIELPFIKFSKSKLGKNGRHSRCNKCHAIYNREHKRKTGWERSYVKRKRRTDINFYMKGILRGRLIDALKRHTSGGNVNKKHSAILMLGCSMDIFKLHLETQFRDGMTWENRGSYWEIDHIIPCSAFKLEHIAHQMLCFNYRNLQPLTVSENRSKGNRY